MVKRNIIIIGLRGWQTLAHLASEHIAEELACLGYRVVYISPPTGFVENLINCFRKRKFGFITSFLAALFNFGKISSVKENLFVASTPSVFLGFGFFKINDYINELLVWRYINKIKKDLKFEDYFLYTTHCFPTKNRDKNCKFFIYDCVDNLQSLPNSPIQSNGFKRLEYEVMKNVNLWFAISGPLFEERKIINPNGYLELPSIDPDNFIKYPKSAKIKELMDRFDKPIVGLVSTMSNQKIDWELLYFIACTRPMYNFVFAGPCTDVPPQNLKSLKNVHFIGPQKFEDVPYLLEFFDVCIVPFKKGIFGNYAFPTKVLEYLLMGKPVISTDLISLIPYGKIIKIASNKEEFVEKIDQCLKHIDVDTEEGRRFAENCSKKKRAERISLKIEEVYKTKNYWQESSK